MSLLNKLPPATGWDAMMQAFNVNVHTAAHAAAPVKTKALATPEEMGDVAPGGKYTHREDTMQMYTGGWCIFTPQGEFLCSRRQEGSAARLVRTLNKSNKL